MKKKLKDKGFDLWKNLQVLIYTLLFITET